MDYISRIHLFVDLFIILFVYLSIKHKRSDNNENVHQSRRERKKKKSKKWKIGLTVDINTTACLGEVTNLELNSGVL